MQVLRPIYLEPCMTTIFSTGMTEKKNGKTIKYFCDNHSVGGYRIRLSKIFK